MLKLMAVARWLRTSQLHRRFFGDATVDAARKRLHKLAKDRYLVKVQPNRMAEALFRLGPEGRRRLERLTTGTFTLERQPPIQLEHFLGINDVRIAAELGLSLAYFFSYWEIPGLNWKQPIIPDAIFGVGSRAFAVELDRGQENLQYFLRTKMTVYRRGLNGFPLHRLLILTDRQTRMEALAKAIGAMGSEVLITRLDLVQRHDFSAPIFFECSLSRKVHLL